MLSPDPTPDTFTLVNALYRRMLDINTLAVMLVNHGQWVPPDIWEANRAELVAECHRLRCNLAELATCIESLERKDSSHHGELS